MKLYFFKYTNSFCLFFFSFLFNVVFSQNLITIPFDNGFVGDISGNNKASNSQYLSGTNGIGWSQIQFSQNSNSNVFIAQGNDIIGMISLTDFSGNTFHINGFVKWRAPSGNNPTTLVFEPDATTSANLTTNGFNGSNTYLIDNTKYIGLTFLQEILIIPGSGLVTGNAATNGLLDKLNEYLVSFSSISVQDITVSEGTIFADIIVNLSSPSPDTITVFYELVDDTALDGSDYIISSGTLTFLPGVTVTTILIPIIDDSLNEPTEQFFVNLSLPANASILDSSGIITILDDDFCPSSPTGDAAQSFCSAATVVELTAIGTTIQWYDAATGGNLLNSTDNLTDGQTVYASQTENGCESSDRLAVTVSLTTTIAPTGVAVQSFCSAATVAELTATGTAIQWYDAASGGNLLNTTDTLSDGQTVYASQTDNGCESSDRLAVTVSLNLTTAPISGGDQTVCNASLFQTLTATATVETGDTLQWYDAATGGNTVADPTLNSLGTITYYAEAQTIATGCVSSLRTAVTLTIAAASSTPTGDAAQSFCTTATVAELTAIGTAIQWYDAASGGNLLNTTDTLSNGQTVYASQTENGCESSDRLAVTVSLTTTIAPTGDAGQSFCTTATVAELTATGTAVQWYDAATGFNLLNSTDSLTDAQTVYASQTDNGCESSDRLAVTISLTTPTAPIGDAAQSFCLVATVAELSATGTTIQWYDAAIGGNLLNTTDTLSDGQTVYASQTENGCESSDRLAVTVSLTTTIAPTGDASQSFCSGVTVAELTATGTTIQWYDAAIGGNLLNSTDSLTEGQTVYASQTENGCESSDRLAVTVSLTTTIAPTGDASQSFCSAATVAELTATGTTIQWYDAATGGNLLNTTDTLNDGQTVYASQTENGCESSDRFQVEIEINTIPTPILLNNELIFCSESAPTLAAVAIDLQGYLLECYDISGNQLSLDTLLEDGQSYFATLFDPLVACESFERLEVSPTLISCEVEIFTALSPNGNGENEFMVIENIENFGENSLEVFNRDGHLLYQQKAYGIDNQVFRGIANVNGIYRSGSNLPIGAYLYVFRYYNPFEQRYFIKKGFLTINSN